MQHVDAALKDVIQQAVEESWAAFVLANPDLLPAGFASVAIAEQVIWDQVKSILTSPDTWAEVIQRLGDVAMPSTAHPWEFLARIGQLTNGYQDPNCDGNDGYHLYQSTDSATGNLDLYQLAPDGTWALATYDQSAPTPPNDALFTPVPGLARTYVVSVPTGNPISPYGIPLARITGELWVNPDASSHGCATNEASTEAVGNQLFNIVWGSLTREYAWLSVILPLPETHLTCATTDAVYTPWTNGPVVARGAFVVSDAANYVASYTATAHAATIDRWQRTGSTWSSGQVFGEPTYNFGGDDVLPRLAISGDGQTVAGCWLGQPPSGEFSIDGSLLQYFPAHYPEIFHFADGTIDYPASGTIDPQGCGHVSLNGTGDTVWYAQTGFGWYASPTAPALAPPSLSIPNDQTVEAEGQNGATVTYQASAQDIGGAVPISCTPPSGSVFPAGTTQVACTATNAGGTSTQTFNVTVIAAAPQTISFAARAVTYGQADFSPASASSALPVSYTNPTGQCRLDLHGLVQITGAGSCTVTANQAGNADWQPAPPVTRTFAVKPATLSVDANDAHTVYGQTPVLSYTLDGFVNGDTSTSEKITGEGDCSLVAGTSQNAGSYPGATICTPGSLETANYQFAAGTTGNLTISQAPLTVTADDQTRLFAASNPVLTATVSGFVSGQALATSGVSGRAACTTTAVAASPVGTYPIICTQGTLSAANYSFPAAGFVAGTLNVTASRTISSAYNGRLTVGAGQAVLIGAGANVTGPVRVQSGGAVDIEQAEIDGPLTVQSGAAGIRACATMISGPVTITGSAGPVMLGDDDGPTTCTGNAITGPVRLTTNRYGVEFDGNTVIGPLTITGNTGALPAPDRGSVDAVANTVSGPSRVQP